MKIERYEELQAKLETSLESQYDYYTTHGDAGDMYMESLGDQYDYSNGDDRLKEYLEENNLPIPDDIERFSLQIIDYAKPITGHIFSTPNKGGFDIAYNPIQEIETQFSHVDLIDALEMDRSELQIFLSMLESDNNFCAAFVRDDVLFYQATDCVWIAQTSLETIKDLLENN
jgi:hypothetical protein